MKVTTTSHGVLLALMAVVVGYHIVTFLVYGAADFAHWCVNHFSTEWEDDVSNYEAYKAELLAKAKLSEEDRQFMEEQRHWKTPRRQLLPQSDTHAPQVALVQRELIYEWPVLPAG